jgi:hypothetical protein
MNVISRDFLNFNPKSYSGLDKLSRIPLSKNFHMREFLYSEVAISHGVLNVPDDVKKAVATGSKLCEHLLEPLQEAFGRIHVRSGYRSRAVNQAGSKKKCAVDNDGFHTWDHPHDKYGMGATACISIPSLSKKILANEVEYQAIAWWIIDHLPEWGFIEFFAPPPGIAYADEVCFNLGWNEKPMRSITTWRGGKRNLHEMIPNADVRKAMWTKLTMS